MINRGFIVIVLDNSVDFAVLCFVLGFALICLSFATVVLWGCLLCSLCNSVVSFYDFTFVVGACELLVRYCFDLFSKFCL